MQAEQVVIYTKRLVLRPLVPADLDTTHEYAGDRENTKYMVYLPNETIEESKVFLQRVACEWAKPEPSFYEFAVVLAGRHIGAVSLCLDKDRREGELGWIIHCDYQGKGYATEAAKAVLEFAIEDLKVKRVVAHCDDRNAASREVMRKIGLSLEREDGIRRNKGSDEDVKELIYALTVTEQ